MIQVQHLSKSFNGRNAVNDIAFEAANCTITGLLGSNGAGKTTTLRMICGILTPDSGAIRVDDSAEEAQNRQRDLGALLDHTGLYSRLTVRENLAYFGRLRGLSLETVTAQTEHLATILGLRPILNRRASGLSQGERMKTALARAVLHSPKNVLLDEPTNGLDVPTVRALREFLLHLRASGACIVFSSHVLDEVRILCDKLVILSRGTVVTQGSPAEICARTKTASLEDAFVQLTSEPEVCTC